MMGFMLGLGAPPNLMMFSRRIDCEEQVYIAVPEAGLLARFLGFTPIGVDDLPPDFSETVLLREDGFDDRFPEIAAKRRAGHRSERVSAGDKIPQLKRPDSPVAPE